MGLVVFWIFTFVAIKFNSNWFRLSKHTYSKLGNPELASFPWIFWLALIIGGALIVSYGIWMTFGNKFQAIGGAYMILSGTFMIMIGPIHDGKKPHDTLAFLTFFLFYVGSAIYGIGSEKLLQKIVQPLILASAIVGMFFKWPSGGYEELYGISLGMISSFLVAVHS